MNINSKSFGFAVAITVAFLWSVYSIGNLLQDLLVYALLNDSNYSNLGNFNWASYANEYLAQVICITLVTGILGWLVSEIYNDFNDMFSLKLK